MNANFYKQGTSAAEDILKKGAAAIPDSVDIHVQLARYYKAKGDAADAKTQYDAAIGAANKNGQPAVATQLQTEENQ
jgi:Tfp pilus assembly protein PilF